MNKCILNANSLFNSCYIDSIHKDSSNSYKCYNVANQSIFMSDITVEQTVDLPYWIEYVLF